MKRDVNLNLLRSILALLVIMAVLTVYYQYSYTQLLKRYQQDNLTLAMQNENLDKTMGELNTSMQRESDLKGKYTDLKSAKEAVDRQLADTRQQLSDITDRYNKLNIEYNRQTIVLDKVKGKVPILEMQSAQLQQHIIENNTAVSSDIAQVIATVKDLKSAIGVI